MDTTLLSAAPSGKVLNVLLQAFPFFICVSFSLKRRGLRRAGTCLA